MHRVWGDHCPNRGRTRQLPPDSTSWRLSVPIVAAGQNHQLCAHDGRLYSWGGTDDPPPNQGKISVMLAHGRYEDGHVRIPTAVHGLESVTPHQIDGGRHFSVLLSDGGECWAWGSSGRTGVGFNDCMQFNSTLQQPCELGNSAAHTAACEARCRFICALAIPQQVHMPERCVQVSCGLDHTLLVTAMRTCSHLVSRNMRSVMVRNIQETASWNTWMPDLRGWQHSIT